MHTKSDTTESSARLTSEAKTSLPWVLALALLGYLYIFLLIIGLILLAALIAYFTFKYSHLWFAKLAILLVISAGLMLKALFVRFPEPEGLLIDQTFAPRLSEIIEELRSKTGCPKIHQVQLTGEFNCGIVQVPKLGILGFHKNILRLGLPILDSVTVDEFKSVLAHEMGHLSKKHGVIACWIYQVQKSWDQLFEVLQASEESVGRLPLQLFARWYDPLFAKYSLALCREHELAADQLAATAAGAAVSCDALIRVHVVLEQLQDKMSERLTFAQQELPEPFPNFFHILRAEVSSKPKEAEVQSTLERNWRIDDDSSHPSLGTRLKALQPSKDWSDLSAIAKQFVSQKHIEETPAELFFAEQTSAVRQQLSDEWYEKKLESWQAEHARLQALKAEFAPLQEAAERNELNFAEAGRLADLLSELLTRDQAILRLRRLIQTFPDNAAILFNLGVQLVFDENEEGIVYLEKAIELDEPYALVGFLAIYSFLRKKGDEKQAKIYEDRIKAHAENQLDKQEETPNSGESNEFTRKSNLFAQWQIVALGVVVICTFVTYESSVHHPTVIPLPEPHNHPAYVREVWTRLKQHWKPINQSQIARSTRVVMEVRRDGTISKTRVERSSGNQAADESALKSIAESAPFPVINGRAEDEVEVLHHTFDSPSIHYTDINDFMADFQLKLKENWFPPHGDRTLRSVLRFTLLPNGQVKNVHVTKSSGDKLMDDASVNAVEQSTPFSIPPTENKPAEIEFTFDYHVNPSQDDDRASTEK
ncbi:MAG: TonB family protein [Candidatus Melainabacteria bacterium]|nr:MAG: TonB family protein [Candidatus Melainabacteria bacterium]